MAVLVEEGDTADLEAHTACMWLETVLLQVALCATQVADVDEGAIRDGMSFALVPCAFVAQTVGCPIPGAIDGLLDAVNVAGGKRQCGGGERVRDMAPKAAVGIGMGEAARGLDERESLVSELFPRICDASRGVDRSGVCRTMADDLRTEGVVSFLLHRPVDPVGVCLSFGEKELLPSVEAGRGNSSSQACRCLV